MEGLVLTEYLIVFYFLIMCLIIVGVVAMRSLGCFIPCAKFNNDDIIQNVQTADPSVYNIPWKHQQSIPCDTSNTVGIEEDPKVSQSLEYSFPYYSTPAQFGRASSCSMRSTSIYSSPFVHQGSQEPVYASISSLNLRPKYASPQIAGSLYFKPVISQSAMYGPPSFVGPQYPKSCLNPVADIHYKVPQSIKGKPVQFLPHPRIAALKAQSAVTRSVSPCRFTVNGDIYAQVNRKNLQPRMNYICKPKQQLIYTF